jgi:acyl dehydratase
MFEAGAQLPERCIASVSAERMKTMAALLQDPNMIHIDPEAVRSLGLGDRVINQGPTNMGYLMNLLLDLAPGARIERIAVRFMANVFAGDAVVARGTVDAVERQADGAEILTCSVALDVESGSRALEGTARVRLPAAA